jgi:hypothetical protein
VTAASQVIIDVRNVYETTIGHFDPQTRQAAAAQLIDPKMRQSTDFPGWLQVACACLGAGCMRVAGEAVAACFSYSVQEPATQEQLEGKDVLMYHPPLAFLPNTMANLSPHIVTRCSCIAPAAYAASARRLSCARRPPHTSQTTTTVEMDYNPPLPDTHTHTHICV